MGITTENYNLQKPDKKDKVSVEILNRNMDILDSCIKKIEDQVSNNESQRITDEEIIALFTE